MVSLILNPKSGKRLGRARPLADILIQHGLEVETFSTVPHGPAEAARRALQSGSTTLVAAGGDGTINAVASAAIASGATLGVMPSGTFNHFAKDMGLPLDPEEAAGVIAAGKVNNVDVGEVNGRVFLNNSSLGLYTRFAMFKEEHRKQGRTRALALFWAVLAVLRRIPFVELRFHSGEEEVHRRTPLLFVGNNKYILDGKEAGTRLSLTEGVLCVYIVNVASSADLLRFSVRALFRGLSAMPELEEIITSQASVSTGRKRARVSMDGEVTRLDTPLHYSVRSAALKLLVP